MNLFLERRCDQGCAFCYARDWLDRRGVEPVRLPALRPLLERYAGLVREAGPPPPWGHGEDEASMLRRASGTVTLLGGEPALHPDFEGVVRLLRELGLGVCLFTAGAHPVPVRAVADQVWFVTINGRFVQRASRLGVEPQRLSAHLPLRPGDEVEALLDQVADAGISSAILAFAAPAGGAKGPFLTPSELPAMRELYDRAVHAAERRGLTLGWDCSFPRCLDPGRFPSRCLPVPVLDPSGMVSACGGSYFDDGAARPLADFASLAELHAFSTGIHRRLEALPTPFQRCAACQDFPQACHGGCLALRAGGGA